MSTNCLVQKLKGSVNNPNLSRLGYLKFVVKHGVTPSDYNDIGFASGKTATLELEGDPQKVYFTDSEREQNLGQVIENYDGGRFDIVNSDDEDAVLWVSNKYDIVKMFTWGHQATNQIAPVDDDGKYILPNLTYVALKPAGSLYFDYISNVALTSILYFNGAGGHLNHLLNLPVVTGVAIRQSPLEGSIEDLGTHPTLNDIELTWDDNVYGKLENLLVSLLNNGRTGTFKADFHGTNVTVKGVTSTTTVKYTATFGTNSITVNAGSTLYIQYDGTNWMDAEGNIYTP